MMFRRADQFTSHRVNCVSRCVCLQSVNFTVFPEVSGVCVMGIVEAK